MRDARQRLLSAILAVVGLAPAAIARAADIGQCATPAAMTEMLKAEDQHSIVTADMITPDKHLYALIITMSADRKTGYILKADQPLGDPAKQLCVYNRLADIRLFDARKPGIDPAVLLKASDSDALRRCDALIKAGQLEKGSCIPLNDAIRRVEPYHQRVVLQGSTVAKTSNGTYKPDGTLTTIKGNIGGTMRDFSDPAIGIIGDILYSSLPEGATVINATLVYVEYTPYGLAQLE